MILSVLFFSLMDILIKITDEYDVGQVMFCRAIFGLIPIFFLIPKKRLKNFYKTKHTRLHFYRSFIGAIAMYAIFVGLRNLELAEVTSMAFSGLLSQPSTSVHAAQLITTAGCSRAKTSATSTASVISNVERERPTRSWLPFWRCKARPNWPLPPVTSIFTKEPLTVSTKNGYRCTSARCRPSRLQTNVVVSNPRR